MGEAKGTGGEGAGDNASRTARPERRPGANNRDAKERLRSNEILLLPRMRAGNACKMASCSSFVDELADSACTLASCALAGRTNQRGATLLG